MIRHAAASAVRALTVAMVETPFRTALMAGPGGSNRPATSCRPTRWCAVGMAAVARRADGEGTAAVTTGSLSEGLVHGVGARGAVSDWTTSLNRGTTAATGSVCRSPRRSRGSRWVAPGPHPTSESARTLPERRAGRQRRGHGRRRSPWTQRARPQGARKTAKNAVSRSAHSRDLHLHQDQHEEIGARASTDERRRIRQFSMVVDSRTPRRYRHGARGGRTGRRCPPVRRARTAPLLRWPRSRWNGTSRNALTGRSRS